MKYFLALNYGKISFFYKILKLFSSLQNNKFCIDNEMCNSGYVCNTQAFHCQKPCVESQDCPSGLVCGAESQFCRPPIHFKEIIGKQRCGEIIKLNCTRDADCGCKGGNYFCDLSDNECIPRKMPKLGDEGDKCVSSTECDNVMTCVENTCRVPDFTGDDPIAFLEQQLRLLRKELGE